MEKNPGKIPPMTLSDPISLDTGNFNPDKGESSLSLGVSFDKEEASVNRGADGKFKKKE